MPRRGFVPKREVLPDPVYGNTIVTKLINQIMLDGNKATAQKIVYDAFEIMKAKLNQEPIEIFNQAMNNVMPVLEVKARRVGGANYQVPIEIRPERRWLSSSASSSMPPKSRPPNSARPICARRLVRVRGSSGSKPVPRACRARSTIPSESAGRKPLSGKLSARIAAS